MALPIARTSAVAATAGVVRWMCASSRRRLPLCSRRVASSGTPITTSFPSASSSSAIIDSLWSLSSSPSSSSLVPTADSSPTQRSGVSTDRRSSPRVSAALCLHPIRCGRRSLHTTAAAAAAASPSPSSSGGAQQQQQLKHEDETLEGRYATALFRVASRSNVLDEVHGDLEGLRTAMKEVPDFKLFVETPGISSEHKAKFLEHLRTKFLPLNETTMNFLLVLLENRRLGELPAIIAAFDNFYCEARGQIKCTVTAGKELSASERKEVVAALQQRVGTSGKLIVNFNTSPSILGGLVVRMGEKVLDFSVATSLDRIQSQLAAPIEA